jgi:signal transduction histidine kinase/ActR/RegA family two-component response regulator
MIDVPDAVNAVLGGHVRPLRVALVYSTIGLAWIVSSSLLVSSGSIVMPELLKGTAFVAVTAIALYMLLRRHDRVTRAAIEKNRGLEAQLRQAQRLEAVGQLIGGVAHDFNNLLTVIIGNSSLLVDELDAEPERRELAATTLSAAERAAELTRRLLAFARRQPLAPRVTDVRELVDGMESLLRRSLGEHIEIELSRSAGLWSAHVDGAQLEGAILNLAINGRDAMPSGGRLSIELSNCDVDFGAAQLLVDVKTGQYLVVTVSDTGTGISPADLEHVFDPFFTTKEVGRGTGLGLSMVFGFVKQSGGHVTIDSELGRGTTVRMYLPRGIAGVDAVEDAAPTVMTGGRETILLVEDDALVRGYAHDQLVGLGYAVVTATNGQEAIEAVRLRTDIDLLFTDIVMPGGLNGRELADVIRRIRPNLPVLFTSGYSDAITHDGRLDAGVLLLGKPYPRADLARSIRQALAAGSPV